MCQKIFTVNTQSVMTAVWITPSRVVQCTAYTTVCGSHGEGGSTFAHTGCTHSLQVSL